MQLEQNTADRVSSPANVSADTKPPLERFLRWMRVTKNRAPLTSTTYADTLDHLQRWLPHHDLLAATPRQLERWIERERRGGEVASPATRRKEVAILRTFYRWALKYELIAVDPTRQMEAPTVHNRNPRPVPDHIWHALWTEGYVAERLRLELGLGYFLGLRRKEMVELRCGQIQPEQLVGFTRKGGGDDTLPWLTMCEVVEENLAHVVGDWRPFGELLLRRAKDGGMNTPVLREAAGIPDAVNKDLTLLCKRRQVEHITPHQLRHSCATNLLRAGVPVHLASGLLNHSSLDVTMRYVRAGANELDEWRQRGRGT